MLNRTSGLHTSKFGENAIGARDYDNCYCLCDSRTTTATTDTIQAPEMTGVEKFQIKNFT